MHCKICNNARANPNGFGNRYIMKKTIKIKNELSRSKQDWITKQVEELIIKKSGIKYHYTHIYRILRKWGFKQKVPRKVHVNTASLEEKDAFKKRLQNRYLWICGSEEERR